MNVKHLIPPGWVFVILIYATMTSSCNMPGLRPTQALASQSQALSGSVPAGHGQARVEYDHHFTFDVSLGKNQIHFDTKVKGFVPLNVVQNGLGHSDCEPGAADLVYEQFSGSSKVDATGSAAYSTGDKGCSCQFNDKIDVQAAAKTTYDEAQVNGHCAVQLRIYIQLKEKWYTAPKWTCQCDDPDDADTAAKMMASIPATSNPELEKQTIKFNYLCPGTYMEEQFADPTGYGSGAYRWIWRPGFDEPSDPGRAVPTQGALSLDPDLYPEGQPSCTEAAVAEWGPSLDSIVQPVTEWYTK